MIVPATITDYDFCVNCNSEHSLELYSSKDEPLNYILMLRMSNFKSLEKSNQYAKYFKCKKCGHIYTILHNATFPVPLISNTTVNHFLNNFNK